MKGQVNRGIVGECNDRYVMNNTFSVVIRGNVFPSELKLCSVTLGVGWGGGGGVGLGSRCSIPPCTCIDQVSVYQVTMQ